jgi:mannose-6-phosphate isomerase
MFYPLMFEPRLKERVWGGRRLEELYGKPLPPHRPIGESWELTDRPGDVSVIVNGPWAGRDLRWLWQSHRQGVWGGAVAWERFPWLIKILDARQLLSVQVHPPAAVAARLGGEPKTELWYITEAAPEAEIYAGLRRGVTREDFERRLWEGTVAECIHRFRVRAGDAVFLPSGRIHALGAGLVLFEIQQNSDTTYRLYDWGRVGLDGRPRTLHWEEALASVDFGDIEPGPVPVAWVESKTGRWRLLVEHELFRVEVWQWQRSTEVCWSGGVCRVLGCVNGVLEVQAGEGSVELRAGRFCLLPAALQSVTLRVSEAAELLAVGPGGR